MADVLRLKPGDDLRMMQTPDTWILGPVLPLIRLEGNERTGLLVLHQDLNRLEVFLLNLHDPRLRGLVNGDKDGIDSIIYSSWQQLYDDGWRVD